MMQPKFVATLMFGILGLALLGHSSRWEAAAVGDAETKNIVGGQIAPADDCKSGTSYTGESGGCKGTCNNNQIYTTGTGKDGTKKAKVSCGTCGGDYSGTETCNDSDL